MPKKSQSSSKPSDVIDPKAAEKAFLSLKPRLLAFAKDKLSTISTDVEEAATGAAAIGRRIKEGEERARFASLPAKHFDQVHVEGLETIAMATWYTAVSLRTASSGASEAKVPAALAQQAMALRERMLRLLSYYVGDDPVDGPELVDIRQGTGYADAASDLVRLAKLYRKRHDVVKNDSKNFVKTDEADAGRCAHAIVTALGEAKNQEQALWSEMMQRSFTLLDTTYAEVKSAGWWLYRSEDPAARFPSLYVMGRSAPSRSVRAPKGGGELPAGGDGGGALVAPTAVASTAAAAPKRKRRKK